MLLRTMLIAFMSTITAASSLGANWSINRLGPTSRALSSQHTFPVSSRAADEFYLAQGNGRNCKITRLEVDMIGNGRAYPNKFSVTIFRNSSALLPNAPGAEVITLPSATSIQQMGFVDPLAGTYLYRVRFDVPGDRIMLAPGRGYWITGFGSCIMPFEHWGMSCTRTSSGITAFTNSAYPVALWGPTLTTGLSFRVLYSQ